MLQKLVTVEDVVNSPMISDPLHRLDCCIVSDGGGALIVTSAEIAKQINRPKVKIIGAGEANKGQNGGMLDLTYSAGQKSGKIAFAEAGIEPSDIKYASIYDSFTITVLIQLEDLGFCAKGDGGKFVMDGNLISGVGKLPFNTDGGGLCNNHPANRGGMTKVIEAVRQLRGEAHPKVQVKNCSLAIAHGTGGMLGHRHASASLILERDSWTNQLNSKIQSLMLKVNIFGKALMRKNYGSKLVMIARKLTITRAATAHFASAAIPIG